MFSFSKISHKHSGRLVEKWVFDSRSDLLSGASIEDVDRDGLKEIIFGTQEGKIFCIDERKQEKWQYAISNQVSEKDSFFYDQEKIDSINKQPTLVDLTDDGFPNVLFASGLGVIHCLDYKGKLLWRYDAKTSVKTLLVVEDVDNDGFKEIVFGTDKGLMILSNQGSLKLLINSSSPVEGTPLVHFSKIQTQLLFGTNEGKLFSCDVDGNILWEYKTLGKITAQPVCEDLGKGNVILVGDHVGIMHCLSEKGELIWRFKTEGSIYSKVAIGDLNDDNKKEIVFGSCDNKVYTLSHKGNLLWSYETDFWVITTPLIFDIDGDGRPEVIIGSYDEHLYILDGEGEYNLDFVPGLSGLVHQSGHYTNILTKDPGNHIGKRLWKLKLQGLVVGCEAVLDGDKHSLIINTKQGLIDDIVHEKT